jgi:hypothetical protein
MASTRLAGLSRFTMLDLTRIWSAPTDVRQLADRAPTSSRSTPRWRFPPASNSADRVRVRIQNLHRNKRAMTLDPKASKCSGGSRKRRMLWLRTFVPMSARDRGSVFRNRRAAELVVHAGPAAAGAGWRAAGGSGADCWIILATRVSREEIRAASWIKSHCSHEQPLDPVQLWSPQGM